MHPTIDEQLRGIGRLLDLVEQEGSLTVDGMESLTNARRLVSQVSRSWSAVLPFYHRDNKALRELLLRSRSVLEPGAVLADDSSADEFDVIAVGEQNAALRACLSSVIQQLPRTEDGATVHSEILRYLAARVVEDPS